jgi:hypothetical protein
MDIQVLNENLLISLCEYQVMENIWAHLNSLVILHCLSVQQMFSLSFYKESIFPNISIQSLSLGLIHKKYLEFINSI